jgi:hypothetical protein
MTLATAGGGGARAEESAEGLLGDWGRLRPLLINHGIDLDLSYIDRANVLVLGLHSSVKF